MNIAATPAPSWKTLLRSLLSPFASPVVDVVKYEWLLNIIPHLIFDNMGKI